MKLLILSQLRFLRFAPWSTLTVLIGVTLGVSSIVAVHQISERVVGSLQSLTPAHLRVVSHLLDRPDLNMSHYFELRGSWRAGAVDGMEAIEGMVPLVEGSVRAGDRQLRVIGVDAFAGVDGLLALAALPAGEVATGADGSHQAGDVLMVNGREHRVAFTYPGLPGDMLITDPGTAQSLLGLDSEALSSIGVSVRTPLTTLSRWSDRLLPGLSAGLPMAGWDLDGWEVRPVVAELPDLAFGRSVLFNLGALGSLALVVAWLLVYQVGVMWLRRRQRTFERLRQMGASSRELRLGFLLGLTGLGLVASLLGLWLGSLLAEGLTQVVTGYGEFGQSGAAGISPWLLAKGVGSAVGIALLGGWIAFEREGRGEEPGGPGWPMLVCVTGIGGGLGIFASDSLLGGFAGIAAVSVLLLASIGPVLRRLRGSSRHMKGPLLVRAGVRELVWYPGDLAVAVGALTLALATSVAMSLMVDSFRSDFESMLDRRMRHDLFVDGGGRDLADLAARLADHQEVDGVQRYGRSGVRVGGRPVVLGYTRFDGAEAARYGLDRPLHPGECLVSERLARLAAVGAGDRLSVGSGGCSVAGVFAGFGDRAPRLLMDTADARMLGVAIRYDRLSVSSDSPERLAAELARLDPTLTVQARAAVRSTALTIFDRTFAITRALTLLALLVAGVGLYNALLALQLQQQHTRDLMDALGASRSELATLERWRAIGVAAAAMGFALPLGLIMGWMLCRVINPRAFGWSLNLLVGWEALLWPMAAAAAAVGLALLLPKPAERMLDDG